MAETLIVQRERVERLAASAPVKHRRFIVRAVMERGLTEDDIAWNAKLGRPAYWKETLDPDTEQKRRAEWERRHLAVVEII